MEIGTVETGTLHHHRARCQVYIRTDFTRGVVAKAIGKLFVVSPQPTDLQEIIRLVEQQKLKPIIDSVFNFADINGAFARSRSKRAQGKILIRIMEEQRRSYPQKRNNRQRAQSQNGKNLLRWLTRTVE